MGYKQSAKFYVFVVTCILAVQTQWVPDEEFCRTPGGEAGDCIVVNTCRPIMDILDAAPQPLPKKVVDLLKSYHCGFSGSQPKVCCPSGPISVPGIDVGTAKPGAAPAPPDVSRHRNIGLLPRNCGDLGTGERIVHGNKTGLTEYPWMTLLSYRTNSGPKFKCGGSIINNRYILTAAHCLSDLQYPLIGVRIGEHNIDTPIDCELTKEGEKICVPPYRDLAIEEIIPHPQYNSKLHTNDIGLLRVSRMDITQDRVKPVCLPLEKTRNYNFTNRNCVVTGWGVTETGRPSPDLLQVKLPAFSNEECSNFYKNLATINHRQMCAGGQVSDSCGGDSGGPLQVVAYLHEDSRLIQQGIVSFGPKNCGKANLPGVYTRVAYYMDWILDTIRS